MSKHAQKYHLIIPEKLLPVLEQYENNPPKISGFSISRMQFLISTILDHKQKDHPFSYSILNMQYLKNIVPRADRYMNLLKQKDIIEWINYSAGRNSRLYRFTKQYRGPNVWRTLTDQNLNRRILENTKRMQYRNSKKYPHLNRFVRMIEINSEAAFKTIEETYQIMIKSNIPETRNKAESRRTFSTGEVFKIMQGQIYIKVNNTNFRYDSNFTRLPSELVKHLTIKGVPLLEIDIVNSQPFFSAGLFDPTPEIQKIMGESLFIYTNELQLKDKQDVKHYTSLVKSGNFYEFLMKEYSNHGILFRDRRDFKDHLFSVFFGENKAAIYSPTVKLFETIFPNVWQLFKFIKRFHHNRLAILLQTIESHTVLDFVAQKIILEFSNIPFITKHDSILLSGDLNKEKIELIENLMIETIEKIIGHCPLLKRK